MPAFDMENKTYEINGHQYMWIVESLRPMNAFFIDRHGQKLSHKEELPLFQMPNKIVRFESNEIRRFCDSRYVRLSNNDKQIVYGDQVKLHGVLVNSKYELKNKILVERVSDGLKKWALASSLYSEELYQKMEAEKQQPKRENNLDNLRSAVNAAKESENVLVASIGKDNYNKLSEELKNAVKYLNDTKRIPITSSDKPE